MAEDKKPVEEEKVEEAAPIEEVVEEPNEELPVVEEIVEVPKKEVQEEPKKEIEKPVEKVKEVVVKYRKKIGGRAIVSARHEDEYVLITDEDSTEYKLTEEEYTKLK